MRVLAVFCNPRGTDHLRLQAEQRVLQQSLKFVSASLDIVPAATIDDLRMALLGQRYDVIHFSGHGCVDGPLQMLVQHKLGSQHANSPMAACVPAAIGSNRIKWVN